MKFGAYMPSGLPTRTMRRAASRTFCASAEAVGTIASSNGRPIATPEARRKVRRFIVLNGMTVPLLIEEHPALYNLVDEGAEAVILLSQLGNDLLDHRAVGELD